MLSLPCAEALPQGRLISWQTSDPAVARNFGVQLEIPKPGLRILGAIARHLNQALRQGMALGFAIAEVGGVAGKDMSKVSRAFSKCKVRDGNSGSR